MLGKVAQDVEGPVAKAQRHAVAPQQPFANRKFERAELQLSISSSARHGFKAPYEVHAHLRDVIHWADRLCAPARSAESGRRFVRNLEAVIFGQNGGDLRPSNRCLLPTNRSARRYVSARLSKMSSGFSRPTNRATGKYLVYALEKCLNS